jgi:succinate dehydrogenase / fumarate reductase cytochrome b subunit
MSVESGVPTASASAGFRRWLFGARRGLEAYMFLLHRLTGLTLLIFVVAHILLGASRLISMSLWAELMQLTRSPWIAGLEYLLLFAFAFHAFNGLRLILVEFGIGIGKPEQPVYPYRGSNLRQRPVLIVMMLLAALLILSSQFELFRFSH